MPNPDYLPLADCKRPEDLDRLNPRVYADLASKSASMLDLFRVQLQVREALERHGEALSKALSGK